MHKQLNVQIIIGAIVGVVVGLILQTISTTSGIGYWLMYFCDIIGTSFIKLLKMILIPLVFTSITVGISNLRKHAQMHKVWPTTLIYFISTTALAVVLGLIVVNIFKPGIGVEVALPQNAMANAPDVAIMSLPEFAKNFITNLFVNPIDAMANAKVLPTVIFAIFFGIALIALKDKAKTTLNLMEDLFEIIMKLVSWIMYLAPYGIAALLVKLVATQDAQLLLSLGKFVAVVIGTTLFHGFITLPILLVIFTGQSPITFFNSVKDALITALSTSSSSATLPITINCVENNLKTDKNIAGFVLPLGATINMDGTAMYEAIAALFIANLIGVDLNIIQQLVVFFTAIVAAIGAPGIPSAGMVTMVMVLQAVGLPAEAIAILLPIDRLLDSVRTMVNVQGDAIGSQIVAKVTKS